MTDLKVPNSAQLRHPNRLSLRNKSADLSRLHRLLLLIGQERGGIMGHCLQVEVRHSELRVRTDWTRVDSTAETETAKGMSDIATLI